jgi:hypothetical protein
MAVALLMFCSTTPSQAGLVITITGSGPTDTMPTIAFSGSGTLGGSINAFAGLTGFDLSGGQYADNSYNNTLVPITGGTISFSISGSNNWTSSITELTLDNDASEPSGGELNVPLNNILNVAASGDTYTFSGTALLNLGVTGRDFSSLNIGNFITFSTAIIPSSDSNNAFGGQPIEMFIIPEPSSLALSLMGAGILFYWRRRRTGKG